ncbi:VOC family protein [Mycobacterium sp. DL440]|uniref:VOC family protein n=1 Tax=Mycobacterium sp. DL440 TaxID=2675523 RepID=UPI001FB91A47|nr:VOC family protein [Mycobacterium sp. DL440]
MKEDEFVVVEVPGGGWLGFQHVDAPSPGKNRAHVDFRSSDRDADVARLLATGASEVEKHQVTPEFGWIVLADPAGNVFCVGGTSSEA